MTRPLVYAGVDPRYAGDGAWIVRCARCSTPCAITRAGQDALAERQREEPFVHVEVNCLECIPWSVYRGLEEVFDPTEATNEEV